MAKKHHHNTSSEEVSTQGCQCCEHRQDARQSFRSMLEGPNLTICAGGNARSSSATTRHRRNQPAPPSAEYHIFTHRCCTTLCPPPWRPSSAHATPHPTEDANKTGSQQASPPPPWRPSTMSRTALAQAVTHHSQGPPLDAH
jgi:hypothetical protein